MLFVLQGEQIMGRTVLVVEDYEDARLFMKFFLESYGYEVFEAADGLEAVECLRTSTPDLVLMDISMPGMDGIAATKAIRKFEEGGNVPIIAVTAFGKEFHKRVFDAGCNALIEKPIDLDKFEVILQHYLPN
jgi:CheY-like chemotaxis protein